MKQYDAEIRRYYKERAPIYDRVYSYPERQSDLRFLEDKVAVQLAGLEVLEVAAGTGYWTQFINTTASSVIATDVTRDALAQVRMRPGLDHVKTVVVDAYSLEVGKTGFSGAFAGLWLSHVPIQRLLEFFDSLHSLLSPGAKVVLIDNSKSQCERLPITHRDADGNTYQDRELGDGSVHRVLKNFPNRAQMEEVTHSCSSGSEFIELDHFWYYSYTFQGS